MNIEEIPWGALLMILAGIYLVLDGIRRYRKPFDSMYLGMTQWEIGLAHGAIPTGVGLILFGMFFTGFFTNRLVGWILFLGAGIIGLGGSLLFIAKFKPPWLQQLEAQYGEMFIYILTQEIFKIGHKKMNRRIQSQEDLDEWVKEVRRKHNLDYKGKYTHS